MGPMDAAAVDDHHDLFPGFAEGGHHLVDILAKLLGIKMRHDLIEHFGGPKLDRANDVEQDASGDTAPGTRPYPGLAFERLRAFDLTLAQWAGRQAIALGAAPPTLTG